MSFADAQARAGAAVSRHLVNACMSVGGQSVPGLLDADPIDAGLGTLGMQTQRRSFSCDLCALNAAQDGLTAGDAAELDGEPMIVSHRTDDFIAGRVVLILAKA